MSDKGDSVRFYQVDARHTSSNFLMHASRFLKTR
jgi:hypothetical protein